MIPLSTRLAALTTGDDDMDWDIEILLSGRTKRFTERGNWVYRNPQPPHDECLEWRPKEWTTDLNAVVAEIERRGWSFLLYVDNYNKNYNVEFYFDNKALGKSYMSSIQKGATPCLALLRALVAAVEATE